MECTHKRLYFKPYDEYYELICLECGKVKKSTEPRLGGGLIGGLISLLISAIFLEESLKIIEKMEVDEILKGLKCQS